MSDAADRARACLAVMEKHRPPKPGIAEVFGEDYADECRRLVAHAVEAGWILDPRRKENAAPVPSSRA
ncbi:MAG: hypothetical protein JJU00_03910 [Opitutales bacterium]|nr:hypothetical protein [Opitutales bacterium]